MAGVGTRVKERGAAIQSAFFGLYGTEDEETEQTEIRMESTRMRGKGEQRRKEEQRHNAWVGIGGSGYLCWFFMCSLTILLHGYRHQKEQRTI